MQPLFDDYGGRDDLEKNMLEERPTLLATNITYSKINLYNKEQQEG